MISFIKSLVFQFLCFSLLADLPSNQLFLLAAQDGLVLGVPTTVNVSSQVADSQEAPLPDKRSSKLVNKEENVVEELHSSLEDLTVIPKDATIKEHAVSEPTVHFHHQHVNIATELSESGQAAVVYTIVDSATSELQQHAEVSLAPEAENNTSRVTVPLRTVSDAQNETQYVVRAEPRQEGVTTAADKESPGAPVPSTQDRESAEVVTANVTEESNDTVVQPPPEEPPQEDIPSFSEWAQKQLAEAEKRKGDNATGGGPLPPAPLKVRHSKNYASPDCGAKVVGANPEAVSSGAVLSASRDEYLLNTCNAKIWFIVELCEAIQPKKVEMANFELFSSSPREFSVSLSDRFPTRDWTLAGRFIAQDERTVQTFNLSQNSHFGKYVKVEIHSHYGQEHYCPVSLFRVYGTSEIEVLDTVDEGHHQASADEDDDDIPLGEGGEAPKNLFGSARDAVLSIVKKAAEALAKSPEEEEKERGNSSSRVMKQTAVVSEPCITPSHIVVCVNCSDDFYHKMYQLMSCHSRLLSQLLDSEFVRFAVANSEFCADRGLDLRVGAPYPTLPPLRPRPINYLQAFLPSETLAALCNLLAVAQKKVVLNTSYEQDSLDHNKTISLPASDGPEVITPVLPSSEGPCEVDGNVSDKPRLATRPPFEPSLSPPLPIRPSRTLRDSFEKDEANESQTEAKVNVTQLPVETATAVPVVMENSSNVTGPAGENMTLVVEDAGSLDSLFSELEQAVVPRKNPAPQKESVFVRLANRIKALERNMSLSGQYLEELSRRYKRQVEDMQRALMGAVEDKRRWEDRDQLRADQLTQLNQQVEALTAAVKSLLEERDSWQHKATVMTQHAVIVVVEVVVFAMVLYICRWLPDVEVSSRKFSVAWPRLKSKDGASVVRRKSVDEVLPQSQPQAKKRRRPSEEALVIAGSTHKELLIPEARRKISKGETRRQRKKRRRELARQGEGDHKLSSTDKSPTDNVTPWWEEEVISPLLPLPPPPPPRPEVVVPPAPRFVQTAVAQRQERIARSSSENSDKENKTFLPLKKPGPFKKIVKKFF